MFLPKEGGGEVATEIELIRSTEEEKGQQIENVRGWQKGRNAVVLSAADASASPPLPSGEGRGEGALRAEPSETENLAYLQNAARERRNVFEALMDAVKTHSLGQISHALYDVGGEYRRSM